jgi:Carboxypeptidase regulatory-like domain
VDRNGNLRSKCAAIGILLLVATSEAQPAGKRQAHAGIVGTVLDEQAHPLKNISVHVVSEKTGMYMPTVDSDEGGHFVIENLEPGTYSIFGESDAAAYPNTALSFYPNENPVKVTLGNFGEANVVLVLGPRAGILCGTVLDKTTGQAIISQHSPHFIVRKVSNREDSIEFAGPAKFRWLIPSATQVTLEVVAEGYKSWVYAQTSSPLTPIPFRLDSGEQKILNINLERQAQQENHPE